MTPCAVAVTSSWIELLLLVFIDLPLLEIANIGPASGADGDGMLWTYIQEMCVSVICTRPESYYKCLLEVGFADSSMQTTLLFVCLYRGDAGAARQFIGLRELRTFCVDIFTWQSKVYLFTFNHLI